MPVYRLKPPSRLSHLPALKVSAPTGTQAAMLAVMEYFTAHGTQGIDPFTLDITHIDGFPVTEGAVREALAEEWREQDGATKGVPLSKSSGFVAAEPGTFLDERVHEFDRHMRQGRMYMPDLDPNCRPSDMHAVGLGALPESVRAFVEAYVAHYIGTMLDATYGDDVPFDPQEHLAVETRAGTLGGIPCYSLYVGDPTAPFNPSGSTMYFREDLTFLGWEET